MRLHFGYQNLIGDSGKVAGGDSNTMAMISGTDLYGTTVAPDGSSTAEGYSNDTALSWRGITTQTRSDLDAGEDIYLWGGYIKPTSDGSIRHIMYVNGDKASNCFGYNISFHDGSVFSAIDNPWMTSDDCLDYGYFSLRNNWIYAYMVCDYRHKSGSGVEFIHYVNANQTSWQVDEGAYMWGFTLEKTQERRLNGPPIITGVNLIDHTDFPVVDFTQLPSNIEEIENDIYGYIKSTTGALMNHSTFVDKNLKTMIWDKINYVKNGRMIHGLRSALRENLEQDCVLFYPKGFKSRIDWAYVRIVDFRFEYTEIPNVAIVEVDYYIINSQRY